MFRASRSEAFLDQSRPRWVDQLLSPESLEATGWFDPDGVASERAAQIRYPRITPRRIIMDLSLTCVIATQLWHHIYLGGGLCELPTWDAMSPGEARTVEPGSAHYKRGCLAFDIGPSTMILGDQFSDNLFRRRVPAHGRLAAVRGDGHLAGD